MSYSKTFKEPDFKKLVTQECIVGIGRGIEGLAIVWFALEITGSYLLVGGMISVSLLPSLFFSLIGGGIVDQFNRKHTLLLTRFFEGFLIGLIPIVYFLDLFVLWQLYLVAILMTIGEVLYEIARSSTIPNILKKDLLEEGNSLINISNTLFSGVGTIAGGLLIYQFSVPTSLVFSTLFFFVGAVVLLPLSRSIGKVQNPSKLKFLFRDIKLGIKYVIKTNILILLLFLAFSFDLIISPLPILEPAVATELMEMKILGFSSVMVATTFGISLGSFTFGKFFRAEKKSLWIGLVGGGTGFLMIYIASHFGMVSWFYLLLMGIFPFFSQFIVITITTFLQKVVPNERRGRVFGFSRFKTELAVLIGPITGGFLLGRIPIRFIFLGMGVFMLVLILFTFILPSNIGEETTV